MGFVPAGTLPIFVSALSFPPVQQKNVKHSDAHNGRALCQPGCANGHEEQ